MSTPTHDQLKKAISLAVNMLVKHEPCDSRAVSDEFVALASVDCGDASGQVMEVIDAALKTAGGEPTPASENPKTESEIASAEGYVIDRHCYPWVAYKGARFRPTEWKYIKTDEECEAIAKAKDALVRLHDFATGELRNTSQLMSNPPKSSAAWDIRNAITREIAALSAKA